MPNNNPSDEVSIKNKPIANGTVTTINTINDVRNNFILMEKIKYDKYDKNNKIQRIKECNVIFSRYNKEFGKSSETCQEYSAKRDDFLKELKDNPLIKNYNNEEDNFNICIEKLLDTWNEHQLACLAFCKEINIIPDKEYTKFLTNLLDKHEIKNKKQITNKSKDYFITEALYHITKHMKTNKNKSINIKEILEKTKKTSHKKIDIYSYTTENQVLEITSYLLNKKFLDIEKKQDNQNILNNFQNFFKNTNIHLKTPILDLAVSSNADNPRSTMNNAVVHQQQQSGCTIQ